MKKFNYFILSGIWIIAAAVNFYTERPLKFVIFNLFAAAIFLSLAILKLIFNTREEKGKKIFNRIGIGYLIALSVFLLAFTAISFSNKPDGYTLESREQLLENLPRGFDWKIASEAELKKHIVSGIYSRDNKSGIAIFTPNGDKKYRLLARQWRDTDDIIISNFVVDNIWYDIIWFNGAKTDYAEITYTYDGNKQEQIIHNSKDMKIFINHSPSSDYALNVVYYDNEGNRYE